MEMRYQYRVTIRLSTRLLELLQRRARATKRTVSDLIREFCKRGLAEERAS